MRGDVTGVVAHVVVGGEVGVVHGAGPCAGPIAGRGREEPGCGGGHPVGRMRRVHVHEVELGVGMVTGHEQVLLVFIRGRVCSRRLHGLRQPSKVKLVGVAFAVDFSHDVLVVVVPQGSGEFVVVHVGFGLALAPAPGHLVRVHELELAVGPLPRDVGRVSRVRQ